MSPRVKPIPKDTSSLCPTIVSSDAVKTIEFCKRAFEARERSRMLGPDGKILHAELRLGDATVFVSDEFPQGTARAPGSLGGTSVVLHLYVEDADEVFGRALGAGATVRMPLANMFWGDRYGQVSDPSGHVWAIATRKENLTAVEIEKRQQEWMDQASGL